MASSKQTDKSKKTGLPAVVYALGVGIFLLGTSEFMVAGLLPEMATDLHASVADTGLLITGFAIGMLLGAPAMAVLTLRLPRRTTLAAALVVFAAGHVVSALADDFAVEFAARVVTAVATGTFWAVAAVVVSSMVGPDSRARGLGVLIGGLTVANVAGVPLGTYVGQAFGWRTQFWLLAVAAVLLLALLLPRIPATGAGESGAAPSVRRELAAFRSGRLWLALGTIAALQTAVFGTFSYLSPLLTDVTGLPPSAVPLVLIVFGLGALAGSVLGGRFGDAAPWRTMFTGMTVVLACLALLVGFGGIAALTVPVIGVLGAAGFSTSAPFNARVIGLAGPAPTLATASATSAFNVGNAIGPWLGGVAIAPLGFTGPAALGIVATLGALGIATLSVRADRAGTTAPGPEQEPACATA